MAPRLVLYRCYEGLRGASREMQFKSRRRLPVGSSLDHTALPLLILIRSQDVRECMKACRGSRSDKE